MVPGTLGSTSNTTMMHNNPPSPDDKSKSPPVKSSTRRQSCSTSAFTLGTLLCVNCRNVDCGTCNNCQGKIKFGGDGRNHLSCEQRRCLQLYPNSTVFDHTATAKTTTTTTTSSAPPPNDITGTQIPAGATTATFGTVTITVTAKAQTTKHRSKVIPSTSTTTTKRESPPKLLPPFKKQKLQTPTMTLSKDGRSDSSQPSPSFKTTTDNNNNIINNSNIENDISLLRHDRKVNTSSMLAMKKITVDTTTITTATINTASTTIVSVPSQQPKPINITTVAQEQKKEQTLLPPQRATTNTTTTTTGISLPLPLTQQPRQRQQQKPCKECIGCEQIQDCNECLQCIRNKQQQNQQTRSKSTSRNTKGITDQNGDDNILCYQRRCYRLLAMGVIHQKQPVLPSTAEQELHVVTTTATVTTKKSSEKAAVTTAATKPTKKALSVPVVMMDSDRIEEFPTTSASNNSGRNIMNIGVRHKITADRSSTTGYFSLTAYLSEKIDSKLFNHNDDDDITNTIETPNRSTTLYGLCRPPVSIPNVCSGCSGFRDDELNNCNTNEEDHPVLLCDGIHCGREYHIACCRPPLVSVPNDNDDPWYCYDCCKDGTTRLLQQYLNQNDIDRVDYYNSNLIAKNNMTYIEYLMQQELRAKLKIGNKNKRRELYPSPESELVIGSMIHSLALCDSSKLARTRGGSEVREPLKPDEYIGKPIHLYDRHNQLYHSGRIVSYRSRVTSWGDYQSPNEFSPSSAAATLPPKDTTTSGEYLIRFPAGKDNRKSTYHHWITLEEHSLSIGTTLVWARVTSSQWTPSILWLRTSLALIPTINSPIRSKLEFDINTSKTKHKVCALTRAFGDEIYSIINVRDQCVDLFDSGATDSHLKSHPDHGLLFSMARTEAAEQSRVRDWYKLKQVDPIGFAVMSSRDYWALRELELPKDNEYNNNDSTLGLLLPNVRRGLDRSKVIQMLQRRGYNVTKDIAASMSCTMVSFDTRTIDALCLNADPNK